MKQSKVQVAKALGVSRGRLYKMLAEGVISPDPDGSINITSARAAMREKLSPVHGGRRTPSTETETFSDARARKERALADTREMEAAVMKGELVRADEILFHMQDVFMRCRARLLALPSKLAMELVSIFKSGQRDPQTAVFNLLTREVREALDELSRFEVAGKGVAE